MTRLDGRFLKPGSIPADRLDPAIPIGGGGALPDGAVIPAKLAASLLQKFVCVSWGEPVSLAPDTRTLALALRDFLGQPVCAAHVLRITCDDRARLSVGGHGLALSGENSADLIAQTDENGVLELLLTCIEPVSISLIAGATQGSPILDATALCEVTFP